MPGFASYARWAALPLSSAAIVMALREARSQEPRGRVEPPARTIGVAAINYRGVSAKALGCPADDTCALEALVRLAAQRGAVLVVAPENAFVQFDPEPVPHVGSRPNDRKAAPAQVRFSALADELDLWLVVNLYTGSVEELYNTQVAFDPDGVVVARHHKFERFDGEREYLTAGGEVNAFDTPFGRVGLLICADMYGDPAKHRALVEDHRVDIVAVSSQWTVPEATRWLAAFAHDWGVYVVGANSSLGRGGGGAVVDPQGEILAQSGTPLDGLPIVLSEIPVGGDED